jgi:hypothetical protein
MTMQRYYLDGFGSEEELASLKTENVFPLVRELEFKFGLKVLRKTGVYTNSGMTGSYQLCNKHGLAVAKVWTETADGGKIEYCYRSPYYSKARGKSDQDKQILRSVKLSSLITALSKHKVVPDLQTLTDKKIAVTKTAIAYMRDALGESRKAVELTPDEVHALLVHYFGENPESHGLPINVNKCKNTLDKYNEADRIRVEKRKEIDRAFRKPYYLIGVDELHHFIIGKFKIVEEDERFNKYVYETVEPFKRYPNIEAYPELIPLMTMVKVAYENFNSAKHGIFPLQDKYDINLDMTFSYTTRPTHYDCLWMTTPCSDI